ncbi:MAG TPA: alpha/beta fold hydrolase [Gaiellaceae bacterium]|nr:alpha/beta fold hydrolase [Gaiellaceae bacterium]
MTDATTLLGLEARDVDAGVRVRYHVGGAGEAVVLVHGLGGAATNWVELVPELVARYRVIALDLPGHGGSAAPHRGSGVGAFADAVAAVIEAEGAEPAVIAGHSFGGHVALRLAERRPELVRALLLLAPAGIATTTRAVQLAVAAGAVLRPARLVAPFRLRYAEASWYRRALFRPWFVSDAEAISPLATIGFLEAAPLHLDTRTAGRAMVADDPRQDLERVACPTLVLWGACDAQLPLEDAFEYARRLRAPLRVIADCGHLLIGERPGACLDALEDLVALCR